MIRISICLGTIALAAAASVAPAAAEHHAMVKAAADPDLEWGPCPDVFPGACEIAVLQGNPAEPNADIFLRTGAGFEFPAHKHTSAERIILVTGEMSLTYEGQETTTLSAGGYAYGPAGKPHVASCISDVPCTLFIAFEDPVDAELVDWAQ